MEKKVTWEEYKEISLGESEDSSESSTIFSSKIGNIIIPHKSIYQKMFKFAILQTNFDITPDVKDKIEACNGVEVLDIYSRYRARIGFGELFDVDMTKGLIARVIKGYPKEIDKIATSLDGKNDYWSIIAYEHGKTEFFSCDEIGEAENFLESKNLEKAKVYKSWEM